MDTSANSMIAVGWTTIRDLINLFFIFILLYAAISTILQYGNYQLKNVLAKIIIAALLINFSLMIGKMVIDASHILAWEFYNRIDVNDTANEAAKAAKKAVEEEVGETEKLFPEVKGDINVKIEEGIIFGPRKLSEVFLAGFNPQRLITASTGGGDIRKEDAFQGVVNETVQKGGKFRNDLVSVDNYHSSSLGIECRCRFHFVGRGHNVYYSHSGSLAGANILSSRLSRNNSS